MPLLESEIKQLPSQEMNVEWDSGTGHRYDEWRGSQPTSVSCNGARGMVIFVVALVLVAYVPYVILNENRGVGGVITVVLFHVPLGLMFLAYVQCMITDPGTVPIWWHEMVEEHAASEYQLCQKSRMRKPPRSHYCSVTRRLVLNMDHYCPWVANTVGYYNKKYFIQFLGYTSLTSLWIVITDLTVFYHDVFPFDLNSGFSRTSQIFSFLFSAVLGVLLGAFTLFHVHMVCRNETTIERSPGGVGFKYNISTRHNWEEVFGTRKLYWFLPLWGNGPAGDGIRWQTTDRDLSIV